MEKIIVVSEQEVLPNADNTLESIIISEQEVVVVENNTTGVVITGIMGPPGIPGTSSLSSMTDVDKTELVDGATLVYKSNTSTWKATNKLDNQILEAGQF